MLFSLMYQSDHRKGMHTTQDKVIQSATEYEDGKQMGWDRLELGDKEWQT